MPVEMIGWIAPRVSSEVLPPQGPPFHADVIAATARIHERADFNRALIGYFSDAPDGFLVGAHAAATTERLGLLLAHRPGFVAPTLAARKLATLDQLSGGRLAVHIIAGGSEADQAKDGRLGQVTAEPVHLAPAGMKVGLAWPGATRLTGCLPRLARCR